MLKDDPLDLVGCPSNLPHCFRGLSDCGKYLNSGLVVPVRLRVSIMACITKRNRIGAMLSPCWTPVPYSISLSSLPIDIFTLQSLYIFSMTLIN